MELDKIKLTPLLDTLRLEKIDDDIYFSKRYSNYISNSRLGLLNPKQGGSPEQFFEGFKDTGYNQSFELGTAVHELTLQPELFELAPEIGKPSAKMGAMAEILYNIYVNRDITDQDIINASDKVNYYKGKMSEDKIKAVREQCAEFWKNKANIMFDLNSTKDLVFLDAKSREIVTGCVDALHQNKAVMDLLHPTGLLTEPISECEKAILLDVQVNCPNGKEFILKLKAKLDNYTIDQETGIITVNDVKTIGKIVSEIDNNIKDYHYNREIAIYLYLLKLCAQKYYNLSEPKLRANYLVVSTIPGHYTKVRPVFLREIYQGFNEFKQLLRYVAYLIAYKNYEFK